LIVGNSNREAKHNTVPVSGSSVELLGIRLQKREQGFIGFLYEKGRRGYTGLGSLSVKVVALKEGPVYSVFFFLFFVFAASAFIAGSSGVPGSVSRAVQSGSTFLHSLIKLTNKTNSKLQSSTSTELDSHLAVFRVLFNLLSNLALNAECRGVMWKVGLRTDHEIIVSGLAFRQKQRFAKLTSKQVATRLLSSFPIFVVFLNANFVALKLTMKIARVN